MWRKSRRPSGGVKVWVGRNYLLGAAINAKRWIRLLAWLREHDTMKKAA
ncbi:MAG: hypothetical protein ABIH24_09375 [Verrucomicrobiota bacterium]